MEITKHSMLKILCTGLFVIAGWSLSEGNETIFPSALVGSLLLLLLIMDRYGESLGSRDRDRLLGRAGRYTLVTFAVLIAVSSLLVSALLPGYAEANNLTGLFDGDFVRVTINDFHEFAYMTSFLLVLCIAFMQYFRMRKHSGAINGLSV
jgi:uncharacterized membrane protein